MIKRRTMANKSVRVVGYCDWCSAMREHTTTSGADAKIASHDDGCAGLLSHEYNWCTIRYVDASYLFCSRRCRYEYGESLAPRQPPQLRPPPKNWGFGDLGSLD